MEVSMGIKVSLRPSELLRPEDLLRNAKYLLDLRQQETIRSVILESMTALEVYIHNKVFQVLDLECDKIFVKWLKEKTNLNFDDRLGYVTPLALDEDIEAFRQSDLWRRYKIARELRNAVTHKGIEVSFEEANKVYQTVYDWLAYLESSIGLELSLNEFKLKILDSRRFSIDNYLQHLTTFFFSSKAGFNLRTFNEVSYPTELTFEWGLKFGQIVVSLGTITAEGTINDFNRLVETVIEETRIKLDSPNIDKAAIILFYNGEIPESYEFVRHFEERRIYFIALRVEVV
jgi:hypothetical protein